MAERKIQEHDLVFALDIGTRSVVGIVGRSAGERFKVLEIELAEHGKRAMMDGQIDDIGQVAALARTVTDRLSERLGVDLQRVCVAAAGRALRTQKGTFTLELEEKQPLEAELISRLEMGAVSAAEEALQENEESKRQMFLVGYTVAQYRLDNYPLSNLTGHNGKRAEADIVATFLPAEVVESLYAAMREAGLHLASLTLEPIAAMNAAIPAELRLLNLALVDIGAGTADIALCKDGSVVGYTMVTVAGDEITEAIMRALLVDFKTAEHIKRSLNQEAGQIAYRNVLGLEESATVESVLELIQDATDHLAQAIAKQIVAVNGSSPSAVFLAGGGSRLFGLRERVAQSLGIDAKRVAIAGSNFAMSAFSDVLNLENPEYTTPLGIAVSAGMGLLNDSYVVLLNGQPAKLFRSGALTVRDVLQMNGYTYSDMIGRTGASLTITLDGKRVVLRGEPAVPAVLQQNDADASLSATVHAGDKICFIPARDGAPASKSLGTLLGSDFTGRALLNNESVDMDTPLRQGDVVLTLEKPAPMPREPVQEQAKLQQPAVSGQELQVMLNDKPLILPPKQGGAPYYLMDLLECSGLDFSRLDRPVQLEVNGKTCEFLYVLKNGDFVTICSR